MCKIHHSILIKSINMQMKVFKALLSGGTKNEDTKEGRREPAHSRCLEARARSPTQVGGLSLCEIKTIKRGTTFFLANKETLSMHWLESLTRNGILATRNDVIRHNDPLTTRLPNSRGAQDQGHTRQHKSFAGLRARGRCLSHRR